MLNFVRSQCPRFSPTLPSDPRPNRLHSIKNNSPIWHLPLIYLPPCLPCVHESHSWLQHSHLNQPTRKTRRSTPRRSALPLHQFQSFHTTHLLLVVHSPGHPLLVLCSQGESRTSSCSSFPRPNSYLRTSSPPPTAATIPSANEREFLVRIPNRKVVGPSQLPELSRVQLPPFQNKPLRS